MAAGTTIGLRGGAEDRNAGPTPPNNSPSRRHHGSTALATWKGALHSSIGSRFPLELCHGATSINDSTSANLADLFVRLREQGPQDVVVVLAEHGSATRNVDCPVVDPPG